MKTLTAMVFAWGALVSAQSQVFASPLDGAVAGAVVGGIIGNNSGHGNGARGAAIGAGAGLLLSSAAYGGGGYSVGYSSGGYRGGYSRPYSGGWYRPYSYYPRYGFSFGYGSPWVYGDYGYSSGYGYDYDVQPYYNTGYTGAGLILGGLAGAIIGNNSGHGNGLRGAAIGAGAGYLLGAVADGEARRQAIAGRAASSNYEPAATSSSAPQNVTIINNYYNTPTTPMSAANGLFGR